VLLAADMTPRFSILTPVHNPPVESLERCIASVLGQRVEDWQWCVVDDCSTDQRIVDRLSRLAESEPRVSYRRLDVNEGIVGATNAALALAEGAFIALLDHDDELTPDALARMAVVIDEVADLDAAYSDEEVWDTTLGRYIRFFKPAWSPERLRGQMYWNHLTMYRKSIVDEVGGFRSGFDGAQDHDLALRVSERARSIKHVPHVLYRWNIAPGSTVENPDAKPWAFDAGLKAVQEHLTRVGVDATAAHGPNLGTYTLRHTVGDEPLVSIIIPSRGPVSVIETGIRHHLIEVVRDIIERTDYANVEVLLVPDLDANMAEFRAAEALDPIRVKVLDSEPPPFNFSRKSNAGAIIARGAYLLFLNDDIAVRSAEWLKEMVGIAREDDVGAVGALLRFEDGSIQHGGVVAHGGCGHVHFEREGDDPGHLDLMHIARESLAVTGACLLVSRAKYFEAGGFATALRSNWNDVDLCLKLRLLGYRNVWTSQADLTHFESVSRDPVVLNEERLFFYARWAEEIEEDPYFTPPISETGRMWDPPAWR
jgi:GT2 family glycosyltransferase